MHFSPPPTLPILSSPPCYEYVHGRYSLKLLAWDLGSVGSCDLVMGSCVHLGQSRLGSDSFCLRAGRGQTVAMMMAASQPTIIIAAYFFHRMSATLRRAEKSPRACSPIEPDWGPPRVKGLHRLWALVCYFSRPLPAALGACFDLRGPVYPVLAHQAWSNPDPALVTVRSQCCSPLWNGCVSGLARTASYTWCHCSSALIPERASA